MLVQCFAENGDMVGVVTKNKAYSLIRKHFAVVVIKNTPLQVHFQKLNIML